MKFILAARSRAHTIGFWERAAFWFLLVLHVLPLCTGRYFPTADGPTHL